MTARGAIVYGLARVVGRPSLLLFALGCGAVSGLCGGAAQAAIRILLGEGGGAGAVGAVGAALALVATLGALSVLAALCALAAVLGRTARGMLARASSLITLIAVERTIESCLLLGGLMPALGWLLAHPEAGPRARALAVTASFAPVLPLLAVTAASFAVALARTAAGEPPVRALAFGIATVLRRLGLVVRVVLLGTVVTAPLWALPLVLGRAIDEAAHPLAAAFALATGGAMAALSALWGYAALLCAFRPPSAPAPR